MNKLIVFICLIVGSFQLSNACNTCQNCVPKLARIMQEIDSETNTNNVLPSQIQVLTTNKFFTVKVNGGVQGWNKRTKTVLLEEYKKCAKTVEAQNLKYTSTHPCRRECRTIRFSPVEQKYEAGKYRDILAYFSSNKKLFNFVKKVTKQAKKKSPKKQVKRITRTVKRRFRI